MIRCSNQGNVGDDELKKIEHLFGRHSLGTWTSGRLAIVECIGEMREMRVLGIVFSFYNVQFGLQSIFVYSDNEALGRCSALVVLVLIVSWGSLPWLFRRSRFRRLAVAVIRCR